MFAIIPSTGVLTLLKHPYPRDVQEPVQYETVRVHAEWGNRPSSGTDAGRTDLSVWQYFSYIFMHISTL